MTTQTQEQVIRSVLDDDIAYIETFMKIPPKKAEGERVPMKLWPIQQRLIANMTGRDIIIKDSQCGCTSAWLALFLKRTITKADTTSVLMSHREFLTQRLLQRAQVMYDTIPDEMKPPQDHKGTSSKRFPDINSVLYIGTAKAETFGRGEPIHNMLFSEEGFYPPSAHREIIIPSLQRVPDDGTVIRESTPNGESGSFFDEVQLCLKGESTYNLQMVFWWENLDNTLSKFHPRAMPGDEDTVAPWPEEFALIEKHNLTEDQLRWRHWKVRESKELFAQEHMEDIDTCFLVMGEPLYDAILLLSMSDDVYDPKPGGPGKCSYWEEPQEGGVYVIGGDPGQGKITESVAIVIRADLERPKMVAKLAGLIPGEPFAAMTAAIARWYNNALIVPEANAHGVLYCSELRKLNLNLYMRRSIVNKKVTMEVGWYTSGSSKPFMMQEIARMLPSIDIYDYETIRQLRGWKEVQGVAIPETSTADDHHDALGLALCGMTLAKPTSRRGFKGTSGWSW